MSSSSDSPKPAPVHPNPPLLRRVHPCVFFAKDLLQPNNNKYSPYLFDQQKFSDYTSKRPVIPPSWITKANKIIQTHASQPIASDAPPAHDPFVVKFTIPSLDYADEVLRLADAYETKHTVPALVTPIAKRRNRYGGGGFVAEKYRVPLSLYSTAYLDDVESDHIEMLTSTSNIGTFLPNNSLDIGGVSKAIIASLHKEELEQAYGITITRLGNGDYTNASDIVPPLLFRGQYEHASAKLPNNLSFDGESLPAPHLRSDENPDIATIAPSNHPFLDNFINLPPSVQHPTYEVPSSSYICTHAPTSATNSLFYQLIFEQRCQLVVALTPCEPYWPFQYASDDENTNDTGKEQPSGACVGTTDIDDAPKGPDALTKVGAMERFGDFLVQVDKIERFPMSSAAIARHVTITHHPPYYNDLSSDSDDDENYTEFGPRQHKCVLLQYLDWPDMGTPELNSFVDFYQVYQLVQGRLTNTAIQIPHPTATETTCEVRVTTPVLVHCAAGIGRTGTFVMMDILWSHLQSVLNALPIHFESVGADFAQHLRTEEGLFNQHLVVESIPHLLLSLRTARFQMVQTSQQLRFIAEFIEYYVNCYLHSFILSK